MCKKVRQDAQAVARKAGLSKSRQGPDNSAKFRGPKKNWNDERTPGEKGAFAWMISRPWAVRTDHVCMAMLPTPPHWTIQNLTILDEDLAVEDVAWLDDSDVGMDADTEEDATA